MQLEFISLILKNISVYFEQSKHRVHCNVFTEPYVYSYGSIELYIF